MPRRAQVQALYCLSGAVSLVYQVAWFRIFVDHFGSTNATFALVVSAFIGGLGLGALASRAVSARLGAWMRGAPSLRVYGALELGVAAAALLTPGLDLLPDPLFGSFPYELHQGIWEETLGPRLVRIGAAALCVLLPCILMGTTFPLLCHAFGEDSRFPSALYAWNTLGACSGILLFELALLPALGHDRAFLLAAAANAAIGVFFLLPAGDGGAAAPTPHPPPAPASSLAGRRIAVLVACALLGGLVTGVLEADVFRRIRYTAFRSELAMPFLSFWAIVAIFLASLTVRLRPWLSLQAIGLAYAAAVAYQALFWAGAFFLEDLLLGLQARGAEVAAAPDQSAYTGIFLRHSGPGATLAFLGLAVLPPFYAFSLLLPWACNQLQGERRHLGRAYGGNTLAFCAGLLFFSHVAPRVNAFYSVKLALVTLAIGAALVWMLRDGLPLRRRDLALAALAWLLACGVTPRGFDPGFFRPDDLAARGEVRALRSNGDTTTFVVGDARGDVLYFDNFNMSGTAIEAARYMRLMAHFPLLAHPEPKTALVICFGVGNTASAVASHGDIERIDIVDLNEQVLLTAPEFTATHGGVHEDPRVRLIHDDGRRFLARSSARYDLITSEPPPPLFEGVYRLYSREYYETAREHLTPHGLMTQWLPIRQMPERAIRLAVSTFVASFPHSLLFVGSAYDFILVGSQQPIDLGRIERRFGRFPRAVEDMRRVSVRTPLNLLARVVKSGRQLEREYAGTPVISDQRRDWAFAFFDPARPPRITYDPIGLARELDLDALRSGGRLRQIFGNLALVTSYVQDFPLTSLTSVPAGAPGIAFAGADWNEIHRLNTRALAAAEAGRQEEAIAGYRASLAIAGDQLSVLLALAPLEAHAGELDASAASWNRAAALAPGDAKIASSARRARERAARPETGR